MYKKLNNQHSKDNAEDIQISNWRNLPVKGIEFIVEPDSSFEKLILDLNVELRNFESYSKHEKLSEKVTESVIKINSLNREVVNWVARVRGPEMTFTLAHRSMELSVVIMGMYDDNPNIEEKFKTEVQAELAGLCSDLFNDNFRAAINEDFWEQLKYYEWLKKEQFLQETTASVYAKSKEKQYFSDEELEKFFNENRKAFIQKMLNENRKQSLIVAGGCRLSVESPIHDSFCSIGFSAYKTLQKALSFITT